MHLIIYGPEGSGKGTQAEIISEKTGIPVITSGDLVREAAKKDNGDEGQKCREALRTGIYVDDNTMFTLWSSKLSEERAKAGFILDGFPRNRKQAEFLFELTRKNGYAIDRLVNIKISDEEAKKRLILRNRSLFEGSTEKHDSPERIESRLRAFHMMEKEMVNFFKEKNILLEIDGSGSVEEVARRISAGLGIK